MVISSSRPLFHATWNHLRRYMRPLSYVTTLLMLSAFLHPVSLRSQTTDDSLRFPVPINSYILKEVGASTILMAKDVDRQVSPASLTKILTCTIAIESGRLEQDVLITKESTLVEPSKAGFKPGEKIKLIDLVKAAMVNSSNDAAFAIAIFLSGNVDSFVATMNAKAKMIGMNNSRFTNPAGFDKGIYTGNTSTAADLLRLTEYAVKNQKFNEIAHLDKAVFTEETTHKVYCLKTHNKLLDKYPYAVGIKTGYTTKAGGCLIARAIKNNKDILLVMLNAKTDRWNLAANMFDIAFVGGKPDPAWIVKTSQDDTARTIVPRMKERENADTVSHVKWSKKTHRLSQHSSLSKRHVHALAKSGRRPKNHILATSKHNHQLKHKNIAVSKSGGKIRRHELASSKSVRKSKKKITVSLHVSQQQQIAV